jgi:enamine deaminase RidA (YjgF/YER057c/UK114 family)
MGVHPWLQSNYLHMRSLFIFLSLIGVLKSEAQTPEETLARLNISLPPLSQPVANYVHCVRVGNILYLAGKGPQLNGEYVKGKLGKDLSVEQGKDAARLVALLQLAVLKQELGELFKVKRIIKANGFVNSTDTFTEHPEVINGFSDLLELVFGDKGRHARTSVGVNSLPFGMAVEIELIVELE